MYLTYSCSLCHYNCQNWFKVQNTKG